jgi:Phosphoglycerate dehydrogenase and related dehydrogenases
MGKILITPRSFSRYGSEAIKLMEAKGYEIISNQTGKSYSYEKFCELSSDVEGIILGVDRVDEYMLRGAKKLRGISRFGVGIDNIDVKTANQLGIKVARAIGSNSTSVAELTVGFLFILARNLVDNVNEVRAGNWNKTSGNELCGKTLGLIGLGAIGQKVAAMAQSVGMKIIGYDPFVDTLEFKQKHNIDVIGFEAVLRQSDYVSLHMPLVEETQGVINKEALQLMKRTAYLINTARGGLINEDDLYEALIKHRIAGAAADVLIAEPPDKNAKLLALDNFVLSPHIASLTVNAEKNTIDLATKNLLQMLEG